MFKLVLMLMMLNMMFCLSHHPLTLALILMMTTLIISLMTGLLNLNFWFSFLLFMIMIGGMLVLIIYMTTIASNELLESSKKIIIWSILNFSLMMILIPLDLSIFNLMNKNFDTSIFINFKLHFFISKFIFNNHLPLIMLTINYLFLALIAIVKITNIQYGSLRQKF